MSGIAERDMPIVTSRWEGDRWVLALPGGEREARDDREAVELVRAWAPGSCIKWVLPALATELITEPDISSPAFRSAPDAEHAVRGGPEGR